MYDTLVGKQRALIFPVMCNGFIKIDKTKNIPDEPYGIWAYSGPFTFEFVITPYDVNGYGKWSANTPRSISESKKIMPGIPVEYTDATINNYQSNLYLEKFDSVDDEDRMNLRMCLFKSSTLKIYLKNKTYHNENYPASFKLEVELTIDGTTETFTSENVILPSFRQNYVYGTEPFTGTSLKPNGFTQSGKYEYVSIGSLTSNFTGGGSTLSVSSGVLAEVFNRPSEGGVEVFLRDDFSFLSVGRVVTKSASTISLNSPYSEDISSGTVLYRRAYAEPSYINSYFHVAISYTDSNNALTLYLNGRPILQDTHSSSESFSFPDDSAYYIGANGNGGTGTNAAFDNEQFMGEIHEASLEKRSKSEFMSSSNLYPNYNDLLFYMRFEEVDQ